MWRPFLGGKLLDNLCGKEPCCDGHWPERWLGSTVAGSDRKGISLLEDGRPLTAIAPEEPSVLFKLIDSCTRLMIQVHPNDAQAQRWFDQPNGKTECWYILNTRPVNGVEPFVFLGFKEGITRELWQECFETQDVARMEACLNRVPVKPGDCFYVPAGVPHAMGSGVFFAEVQQPSDLVFRTERISPAGEPLTDQQLHMHAGVEAMFDCFTYTASDPESFRIEPKEEYLIHIPPFGLMEPVAGKCYPVDRAVVLVVVSGKGFLNGQPIQKGDEYFLTEPYCLEGDAQALAFLVS